MNEELRAITNSQRMRLSADVMSSTMPSAKYSCSGTPLMFSHANPERAYLSRDVLQVLLADVLEAAIQPARGRLLHDTGDQDAARLGQRFQPRGHVHAVAVDILTGHYHVADVDADAQLNGVVRLETRLALNVERTPY